MAPQSQSEQQDARALDELSCRRPYACAAAQLNSPVSNGQALRLGRRRSRGKRGDADHCSLRF
jgi:hypothetical protein